MKQFGRMSLFRCFKIKWLLPCSATAGRMRIVGVGVDLLAVQRIRDLISRRGAAALARRILSASEQGELLRCEDVPRFLQARFAIKEALFKAASSHARLLWSEVTVSKDRLGKPTVLLARHPELAAQVSLSHDGGLLVAVAFVTAQH